MSLLLQFAFVATVSVAVIGGSLWVARRKSRSERVVLSQTIAANKVPMALGFSGIAIALLGVAMALHAYSSATVEVDLARLQAGAEPPASFVATEGIAVADERYCSLGRGGRKSCYTPLWSAEAARDRVAMVIHGTTEREGRLSLMGYAGSEPQLHVRRGLEAKGLRLAEHARVLMVGETPNERVKIGALIGLAGLGLLLAAWLWRTVAARMTRRSRQA